MAIWKKISLTVLSLFLLVFLLTGCGVPQEEYDKIERDLGLAQMELSQATRELTQRSAEAQQLKGELTSLENQYNNLQSNYDELYDEHQELLVDYTDTKLKYISALEELGSALEELGQSLKVPYTAISGRQITYAWENMNGELHKWTLPVDSYRGWIELPKPDITVSLESGGKTYTMTDFTFYVRSGIFEEVVPTFYEEHTDEMVFAQEAFNLVSQLTVYSEEIGEVPRWPAETLTEAGGDCEDLAILYASLLKAAPYSYKVSLVYMDGDNPTDPQVPNHVIVFVEADDWKAFVECTSKQGWNYYESVVGWYYKL